MTVTRITSFTSEDLADMDSLMRQLCQTSSCNGRKLADALRDVNSRVLVAREDDRIVGTVTLCIHHTPEFTLGAVEAMVVSAEYRGRHISENLMEALLREAEEAGVQKIHLTSRPSRIAANGLYQKLGFQRRETNVYEIEIQGNC